MRYTTLIDITQCEALYTNINIRLVYLHLVLKAGYHDHDKDIVNISIRRLAADVGISVSATRHAIKQLVKYKMVNQAKGALAVRKWCPEQPITTRQKLQQQKQKYEWKRDAYREVNTSLSAFEKGIFDNILPHIGGLKNGV